MKRRIACYPVWSGLLWSGLGAGLVVVVAAATAGGCGGEQPEEPTQAPQPDTQELPPPMPDTASRDRSTQVPVGKQYFMDALATLETQTAVVWVDHEDTEVYVGILEAVFQNDSEPVVDVCQRVQKTKGEPVTIYFVDDAVADKGWRPGDDGLVQKLELPIKVKLGGE